MEKNASNRHGIRIIATLCVAALAGAACAQEARNPDAPDGQSMRLERLKASGKDSSLTVLPVGLAGKPSPQVGEALGILLERGGMKNLEVGTTEFRPTEKADLAQTVTSLGEFVKTNPPTTDFVLFADFLGVPGKGISEVRGVIVNKQGEVAWQDRQTADDADFKRMKPGEPMTGCLFVVERLRPVLNLGDPNRENAPQGKLAQRWEQKTGVANEAELKAMKERQQIFKKAAASATLLVHPVRAGGKSISEGAVHLAKLLNDAKLIMATAASDGPQLDIKGDMNEQKVLWGMARAFRAHVQAHPPEADYVLFADYLMGKDALGKDAVGGVHFAVCDRKGELVIVDYQNDHHADFKAIKPKTSEDCDRLVLKRLEGYCK